MEEWLKFIKNRSNSFSLLERFRLPITLSITDSLWQNQFEMMPASEPDHDVIRWGLNLLDVGLFFSSNYGRNCSQDHHDGSICQGQFMREYNYDTVYNSDGNYVENDAVIAHALQEEFSRFQVDDAAQSAHVGLNQFEQSDVSTNWLQPSSIDYSTDNTAHSGSCSSPGERFNNGANCSYPLEFVDESSVDGELGKRLNQMVPVPHVPRINGEIPSVDEATSDHQRMLDRLKLYDLVELKVQGDGNCQFRALSDQFYRTPEHHQFVRQQVVNQLKAHQEYYEGYVPMEYGEYLKKMSMSSEWGDHVTLQAAADSYGVKIFLMTSFKDTCYMEIIPKVQMSRRIILLSFWAEVHYNSIYPEGEV